jgi:hypothetical protein
MSYDAAIIVPGVGLVCLLGWWLLAAGRPYAASLITLITAALFAQTVYYWGFVYQNRPHTSHTHTWNDTIIFADAVTERARVAASYLPFAMVPLVLGMVAAWKAWGPRLRMRVPAYLGVIASVPTLVLAWWVLVSPQFVLSSGDPLRGWGYYREWRHQGADIRHGSSACFAVVEGLRTPGVRARLRATVTDEEIQRATQDCTAVCAAQSQSHQWNPGVLEDICRTFLMQH